METFEDFKSDAKSFDNIVQIQLMRKYQAFMDYLSKIIQTILKDNEKEIISWLKQIKNSDKTLTLFARYVNYIRVGIGLSNDESHIIIKSISSRDKFYDPIVEFSSDENIKEFFRSDYNSFLQFYTPCNRNAENLVIDFKNQFNNAFYEKFKSKFESIWLDENSFKKSKYALSFSEEKRSEISNQILEYYDKFTKIILESNETIEAAKEHVM